MESGIQTAFAKFANKWISFLEIEPRKWLIPLVSSCLSESGGSESIKMEGTCCASLNFNSQTEHEISWSSNRVLVFQSSLCILRTKLMGGILGPPVSSWIFYMMLLSDVHILSLCPLQEGFFHLLLFYSFLSSPSSSASASSSFCLTYSKEYIWRNSDSSQNLQETREQGSANKEE